MEVKVDSEEFKKMWAEIVNKRMGPAEMWGTIAKKIYPGMKIGGGESPCGNGEIAREIEVKRKLLCDIGKGIVSVPDQKESFLALQKDISRLESVLPERKVGLDGLSPGPCIADETAGFTDEHWAMLGEALKEQKKTCICMEIGGENELYRRAKEDYCKKQIDNQGNW